MALSDIVEITITTESVRVERAGFGVPLILAADAPGGFTERVRFYTDLTAVVADFAATTATYKMASAIFSQVVRPPRIAVGRLALPPTQRWAITPVAANSTKYQINVTSAAGVETLVEYTSDASATVAEIIAGLKSAIDALSLPITTSDQTTFLRVVANSAGATVGLEALNVALLGIKQDHADPGAATDLAAIALENNDWYVILNAFNSDAMAEAIADWAESNKKLFLGATQNSGVVQLSSGSDTGGSITIAGTLKASANFRTALFYHPANFAFPDAAAAGAILPLDPGSETWMFKTLSGVEVVPLTATQRLNALAKWVNVYETHAGVNHLSEGKVSGNEFIDVIRFRDWLEANMQADVFAALAKARKVPFTDAGIAVIEGVIRARLQAGVDVGGLASDPAPAVTVPAAADISDDDKANRRLTGVKFSGTLAGAIHAVDITGVISV